MLTIPQLVLNEVSYTEIVKRDHATLAFAIIGLVGGGVSAIYGLLAMGFKSSGIVIKKVVERQLKSASMHGAAVVAGVGAVTAGSIGVAQMAAQMTDMATGR